MNGSKKRYEGLTSCKNYRDAITLIKKGGYATDSGYVDKICNIINRFGLDRYDNEIVPKSDEKEEDDDTEYAVQTGAYKTEKYLNQHLDKLAAKGYTIKNKKVRVIKLADGQSHVIVGVYKVPENAKKKQALMAKDGFETTVIEI